MAGIGLVCAMDARGGQQRSHESGLGLIAQQHRALRAIGQRILQQLPADTGCRTADEQLPPLETGCGCGSRYTIPLAGTDASR